MNKTVLLVSVEKTELNNGTTDYDVYCHFGLGNNDNRGTYKDEFQALSAAHKFDAPVVRMGWAKRNQWIEWIEKGMQP